jgi:HlyD family secretion protein
MFGPPYDLLSRASPLPRIAPFVLAAAALVAACGSGEDDLLLVGSVERTQVELIAPASEVILEIPVRRGEHVEAGARIARLDATLARAELARAEAALAGARTSLRVSEQELSRARRLRSGAVASQQQLERAELARDEAEARLREAEALLAVARKHIADLDLRAPAPAVVDQLPFEVGERVPAGAVLGVLLADGNPWVRIWIPETHVALVFPGTRAEIHIDGYEDWGSPFAGEVIDIAREPGFTPHYALTERDRVHLVYEARVAIQNAPAPLRPGVPADVRLVLDPVMRGAGSGDGAAAPRDRTRER